MTSLYGRVFSILSIILPIVFAESKEKTTGFKLEAKGDKKILTAPELWGGRIWPRTECKKQKDGKFVCKSGDCEGTDENCGTTGDVCTLGEWTLAPENKPEGSVAPDADWYDLSLVDGKIKVLVADDLGVDLSILSVRNGRLQRTDANHAQQTYRIMHGAYLPQGHSRDMSKGTLV